jgi:hypothetical protein
MSVRETSQAIVKSFSGIHRRKWRKLKLVFFFMRGQKAAGERRDEAGLKKTLEIKPLLNQRIFGL